MFYSFLAALCFLFLLGFVIAEIGGIEQASRYIRLGQGATATIVSLWLVTKALSFDSWVASAVWALFALLMACVALRALKAECKAWWKEQQPVVGSFLSGKSR